MNYSHSAYGLIVHCFMPLKELSFFEKEADVIIRLDAIDSSLLEVIYNGKDYQVTTQGILLFWKNEGKFLVRDGKEIIVDPDPNLDERTLKLIIEGPALGVILHQRGRLPLHAAAVEIDGNAVALMGDVGAGKSALAAALYKRGHLFVSDDLTAVQPDVGDVPVVSPGFPQLKLWPKVISALGDDPEVLPYVEPGTEKRSLIPSRFSDKPAPLKKIYLLNGEQTKSTMSLAPQDALLEVIRHSYRAPLLRWIGPQRHLHQCAQLINAVPVRRLSGPLSRASLADAARTLEDDLTA